MVFTERINNGEQNDIARAMADWENDGGASPVDNQVRRYSTAGFVPESTFEQQKPSDPSVIKVESSAYDVVPVKEEIEAERQALLDKTTHMGD